LDELFEAMTLIQTKNTNSYYTSRNWVLVRINWMDKKC
jgi:predicted Rossmann-fold nucleotide-binding protein